MIERVALVTDFGDSSAYVGQLALLSAARFDGLPVVNLIADLQPFRPDLSAYLLPALIRGMPSETLYLCVVDPGVGSERDAVVLHADDNWYVGPDNGLMALLARRAGQCECWRVDWRPPIISHTFHGRDLFLPIGWRLVQEQAVPGVPQDPSALVGWDWADDVAVLIYKDRFGNLCSGLRAKAFTSVRQIKVNQHLLRRVDTFSDVLPGQPICYENSFGLIELAVNQGRADQVLGLEPGDSLSLW